jgi:hypothetical protein
MWNTLLLTVRKGKGKTRISAAAGKFYIIKKKKKPTFVAVSCLTLMIPNPHT